MNAHKIGFRADLERLINCNSKENGSDTPDYILAEYLDNCLVAFDKAVSRRTAGYAPASKPCDSGVLYRSLTFGSDDGASEYATNEQADVARLREICARASALLSPLRKSDVLGALMILSQAVPRIEKGGP